MWGTFFTNEHHLGLLVKYFQHVITKYSMNISFYLILLICKDFEILKPIFGKQIYISLGATIFMDQAKNNHYN